MQSFPRYHGLVFNAKENFFHSDWYCNTDSPLLSRIFSTRAYSPRCLPSAFLRRITLTSGTILLTSSMNIIFLRRPIVISLGAW